MSLRGCARCPAGSGAGCWTVYVATRIRIRRGGFCASWRVGLSSLLRAGFRLPDSALFGPVTLPCPVYPLRSGYQGAGILATWRNSFRSMLPDSLRFLFVATMAQS